MSAPLPIIPSVTVPILSQDLIVSMVYPSNLLTRLSGSRFSSFPFVFLGKHRSVTTSMFRAPQCTQAPHTPWNKQQSSATCSASQHPLFSGPFQCCTWHALTSLWHGSYPPRALGLSWNSDLASGVSSVPFPQPSRPSHPRTQVGLAHCALDAACLPELITHWPVICLLACLPPRKKFLLWPQLEYRFSCC